ncbi:MAG TPA: hypothetical protein VHB73_07605 [Alphaproteobacteria bacterium]|nr:hypothetical protein [Alphaproteobacteria bacterium]
MAVLNHKIEIDENHPLPEFDGSFARAYAAKSKSETQLMALVVESPLAVRGDMINAMRAVQHPSLMSLRETGTLAWPACGGRAFAFTYALPLGQRLAPKGGGAFPAIKDEALIADIATPLFAALNELGRAGLFHGGVRADNIFGGTTEGQKATLGENLAAPAGFGQPCVYETIERGMSEGACRGPGTPADDCYALGVTLLTAFLGEEPLRGQGPQAILNLKLERGSYAALAGERRFSPAMLELLHGLLVDDPRERWTYLDFERWLEGRRLTPKPSMADQRATRPFVFMGQSYLQPRALAMALAAQPAQAAAAINSDELGRWLTHALNDSTMSAAYEEARQISRRQRHGPEEERLTAHILLALDPAGPIRYRGISVFPSALGAAIAEAALNEAPLEPFSEILLNELPMRWLTAQGAKKPDIVGFVQNLERLRDTAEKPGWGLGPERVMYEISPAQPCLAPPLRQSYALTPLQLMEALDQRPGGGALLDRHVSAFLLARDKKLMPQVMRTFENATTTAKRGLALLTLFAELQHRFGPERLSNLARALLPGAEEAVKRFHNKPRQEQIRASLRPTADSGSIPALLKLVDDEAVVLLDAQEYEAAKILYRAAEEEIARLAVNGKDKSMLASQAGYPVAAAISVTAAFMLASFLLVRFFMVGV